MAHLYFVTVKRYELLREKALYKYISDIIIVVVSAAVVVIVAVTVVVEL